METLACDGPVTTRQWHRPEYPEKGTCSYYRKRPRVSIKCWIPPEKKENSLRGSDRWITFPVAAEHRRRASAASGQEALFSDLFAEWKGATKVTSSLTEIVTHPAYQRIIGMGPSALPFIIRSLEREPDHWFWALRAITGDDPVQPEDRGRLRRMAAAWLEWAREHGWI